MHVRRRRGESFLPDPTPEEIRRQTASIRQSWSARERDRRSYYRPTPWMPPVLGSREFSDTAYEEGAA